MYTLIIQVCLYRKDIVQHPAGKRVLGKTHVQRTFEVTWTKLGKYIHVLNHSLKGAVHCARQIFEPGPFTRHENWVNGVKRPVHSIGDWDSGLPKQIIHAPSAEIFPKSAPPVFHYHLAPHTDVQKKRKKRELLRNPQLSYIHRIMQFEILAQPPKYPIKSSHVNWPNSTTCPVQLYDPWRSEWSR